MRGSAKSPEQLQAEQKARDEAAKKLLEEQANREQVTLVAATGLNSGGGSIGPGVTKGTMFGGGGNPLPRSGSGLTIGQQYYVDTDKKGRRYIQLPGSVSGDPGGRAYWNDKIGAFQGGNKDGIGGTLYTSSVLPASVKTSGTDSKSAGSSSKPSSGGPLSASSAEDQMKFHDKQRKAYLSDPDRPLDETALLPVAKVRIPVSVL